VQGTFREHSGNIHGKELKKSTKKKQETCREHSGNIREHSGGEGKLINKKNQGTFGERLGNVQGTFREHSGNIQGTFRSL
jgi:hypothetical protein